MFKLRIFTLLYVNTCVPTLNKQVSGVLLFGKYKKRAKTIDEGAKRIGDGAKEKVGTRKTTEYTTSSNPKGIIET